MIKKVQNGDCAGLQYLVVEEASQRNVQLWADICVAKQRGATIVCLADFGQFEAIAQNWAGTPVQPHALQESAMLRELCCGNRFTLTENSAATRRSPTSSRACALAPRRRDPWRRHWQTPARASPGLPDRQTGCCASATGSAGPSTGR